MLRLHIFGFYEQITPIDEIEDLIRSATRDFISRMRNLINKVKHLDLSEAVKFMDKMSEIKREILTKSSELHEVRQNYITFLERILARKNTNK